MSLVSGASLARRLSFYYAAVFAVIGVHLPFFPLWLDSRGIGASEIGLLLASVSFVRILTTPWIGAMADRRGERRRPMIALAAIAALGFAAYWFAGGIWSLLAIGIVAGVAHAGLMPLGENVTMTLAAARGLDYGRLRLWGSLAFIALSALGGLLIEAGGIDLTIALLVATSLAMLVACAALPDSGQARAVHVRPPALALLGNRTFALFLGTCGALQASHAAMYAIGTVHWRAGGMDETTIGLLSAEAVIAEVLLFALGGRVLARLGPLGLLATAGAAGAVRWLAMAFADALWAIAALQLLHALTFGAAHLAAMHALQRMAPEGFAASAQSTYSAFGMGLAMGAALLATGPLYAAFGAGVYGVMAALSLAGLLGVVALAKKWRGERLAL